MHKGINHKRLSIALIISYGLVGRAGLNIMHNIAIVNTIGSTMDGIVKVILISLRTFKFTLQHRAICPKLIYHFLKCFTVMSFRKHQGSLINFMRRTISTKFFHINSFHIQIFYHASYSFAFGADNKMFVSVLTADNFAATLTNE